MVSLSFIICHLSFSPVMAQSDRQLVRQGNRQFRKGNAADAEVSYRKAVEKNQRNPQASYNLGNALLMQRQDSTAVSQYEAAAKLETNPIRRAMSYHNIGVALQNKKQYGPAIEAYKEALRNNPADDETRYNLEVCKRQKQQQDQNNQNNQDNQNKDNKDNKNQNKDQQKDQNKDKKQDNKDQQDQKDQQKKDQQQQQQQDHQMSRENAEQLLNAAMQEEKQTQERMKKALQQPNSRRLEKNW